LVFAAKAPFKISHISLEAKWQTDWLTVCDSHWEEDEDEEDEECLVECVSCPFDALIAGLRSTVASPSVSSDFGSESDRYVCIKGRIVAD